MAVNRQALAHAVLVALEEELATRTRYRRVFYRTGPGAEWQDWARENDQELRTLFRVRRAAKSAMREESRTLSLGDHFARAPLGVQPVEPETADAISLYKWERDRFAGIGGEV